MCVVPLSADCNPLERVYSLMVAAAPSTRHQSGYFLGGLGDHCALHREGRRHTRCLPTTQHHVPITLLTGYIGKRRGPQDQMEGMPPAVPGEQGPKEQAVLPDSAAEYNINGEHKPFKV